MSHAIRHSIFTRDNVDLHVAVTGSGPLVLFVHGWPEMWCSWRHQLPAVADAGFTAAAIDVRGYGMSGKPLPVEAYMLREVAADLIHVIHALGHDSAHLVGHDWGAPIVWNTTLEHPDIIRGVCGMSVPYMGRPSMPPLQLWDQLYTQKGRFFYQVYFQKQGVAEAEFAGNMIDLLRRVYYSGSAEGMTNRARSGAAPVDATLTEAFNMDVKPMRWLPDHQLAYYARSFEAGGMRGPLNRYRCQDIDFAASADRTDWKIKTPAMFLAGEHDPVLQMVPGADVTSITGKNFDDLRHIEIVSNAGHWVQQEQPDVVSKAVVRFLQETS